ncbi:MAG: DUF192 domain-containing protein [Alphaproteobacteria bacterium PRO2]|nr:DUF192 domain-containing protein [Alphaproteobacteria bacterium PRO2]
MRNFLRAFMIMAAVAALSPASAFANDAKSEAVEVQYLPRDVITIETRAGQDYIFEVEMATESADQARGLMYRSSLNNDSGMLFLFGGESQRTFWMKNTLIPLDMIFIARDGTINHIHHNAKPQDETRITSDTEAMAVLEINGGLAGTLNINEGDKVLHPAFRNVLAPE